MICLSIFWNNSSLETVLVKSNFDSPLYIVNLMSYKEEVLFVTIGENQNYFDMEGNYLYYHWYYSNYYFEFETLIQN